MNRLFFPAFLGLAVVARAFQPTTGQLDASPTVFTVLAAINAAGFDADLAHSHPLRQMVRDELAKRKIPSLPAIKDFVIHHHMSNDTAELSQYLSFAVTAGPPPMFEIKQRQVEIPPDVVPLVEFSALLQAFYREADIDGLWRMAQPYINSYIGIYHAPVLNAVQTVNVYLRQQTSGLSGQRFQIFIDLLEPPNSIQTRSYGNEYTVIVGPSTPLGIGRAPEPRTFDVRHAYLHYLLEPLATHYQEVLARKKALADHLGRAGGINDVYREDFLLLTSESLIKAVESRLDNNPREVDQALHEGFVLAPYFAEQLPVFEKQEQAMSVYYGEMVAAIDLMKEDKRLQGVEFNRKPSERAVIRVAAPDKPLTGVEKTLDDAYSLYTAKQYDQSRTLYLAAMQQTTEKPVQAKAYGGLARIAMARNDPETAETLFQKDLDLGPEPEERAWTLYYLGRLALASGDRDRGIKLIQEALRTTDASDKARKAASEALQQISKN